MVWCGECVDLCGSFDNLEDLDSSFRGLADVRAHRGSLCSGKRAEDEDKHGDEGPVLSSIQIIRPSAIELSSSQVEECKYAILKPSREAESKGVQARSFVLRLSMTIVNFSKLIDQYLIISKTSDGFVV